MKKLLFLFVAITLILLSACSNEIVTESSEPIQSDAEDASAVSEISRELTLEEKFPEYNLELIVNKLYLAKPKGNIEGDVEQHIVASDGRIIKTFCCESINKVPNNNNLLFVVMSDRTAYFINEFGDRTDKTLWESLVVWVQDERGALLGKRGEVYYFLDSNGEETEQITPEPHVEEERDGLKIVSKFNGEDRVYGVMKGDEYIIEPRFLEMPIVKKGKIVVNNNAFDLLSSEGYIYDYSGKLVKQIRGHFAAHRDFNYIIECELIEKDSEDALFSILDCSCKKLYTAPKGTTVGLAYVTMWSPEIMPYHVTVNNVTVHLEKLIDNIEYPPVKVADYQNAVGLNPEKATVVQTPYLVGNIGRMYEVTDELKEHVKAKLISYLTLANIEYGERNITYVEDEGTFFAKVKIPNSVYNVLSYPDSIYRSVADSGDSREPLTDPLSDPLVLEFCQMTFKTTKGLKVEKISNAYLIYEENNGVDKNALSITQKRVVVNLDYHGGFCTAIYAVDMSDENIYPTHTLDALSYDEALQALRNGDYIHPPFDLTEYDYKNGNIEGAKFEYREISYCGCEECQGNIGYYIPCYTFLIRDKDSPEFVGEALVPAIDLDELNELLSSKSLPCVNHFWTEE
ncbi:MAG: hypothetical protein IJY88_03270 [Clostridia bacterium]|nr:hypothetical protein [Clostridia bacterium]